MTYLYKAKKKQPFHLIVTEGRVEEENYSKAAEWVDALMNAAYAGKSNMAVVGLQEILIILKVFLAHVAF